MHWPRGQAGVCFPHCSVETMTHTHPLWDTPLLRVCAPSSTRGYLSGAQRFGNRTAPQALDTPGLCHPSPQTQVPPKVWAPGPMRRGPGSEMPGKRIPTQRAFTFMVTSLLLASVSSSVQGDDTSYLVVGRLKSTSCISQTPAIPEPVTGLLP